MLQVHRLIANCDHGEYFSILGKGEETGLKGRLNQSLGAKASKMAKAAKRLVAMWWEGGAGIDPSRRSFSANFPQRHRYTWLNMFL